ncbi:MAG TPA: tRNA preQ1(34) S-adenosylmethionine ribosyltransferase-isomerase QueA [Chthoniobacterales bacterium]|nr:tRNA preQ1(34) S-adenosylmethionine ribosyltransferase-isomerase QueA [Chthoniobacterales bacterium]
MSLKLSDYDYPLPESLIAKRPLPQRDQSRMMVLHRDSETIEHRQFRDLKTFLRPADLLVLNNTRVLAARRFSDDRVIEFLFLEKLGPARWKCWVKPGRKMRVGATAKIDNVEMRVEEILEEGERVVSLSEDIDIYMHGSMPIPPYVRRESDSADVERYQTVFAQTPGALAAPTAGLHFTPGLLKQIPHTFVTLHVGPGTFKPVHEEKITDHHMHSESFSISDDAAKKINRAGRIVAVGTTTVRTLEFAARVGPTTSTSFERVPPIQNGSTNLFIYPPFEFQIVDALLTNFHLPRSTLLMLVSAFAGREFVLRAYGEAIRERYRFYSYGDCMLIL